MNKMIFSSINSFTAQDGNGSPIARFKQLDLSSGSRGNATYYRRGDWLILACILCCISPPTLIPITSVTVQ